MSHGHLVNTELQAMAIAGASYLSKRGGDSIMPPVRKQAFVPPGPGMDPAMAGGDPAAAGGDPAAAGGAPAGGDPAAAGGGGDPMASLQPMIQQMVQQAMMSSGGGGGGGGGVEPIKPKIDVNVTMLQILKILAKMADTMGVQIPASEMVATQGDLTQFAQQQQAGGGAGGASAIQPPSAIQPMQGASPSGQKSGGDKFNNGEAYAGLGADRLAAAGSKAAMIARMLGQRS